MAGDNAGLDIIGLATHESPAPSAGRPPVSRHHNVGDGFEVVRRGYDQQQVESHLGRLDAQIRILIADRNAAVEQATQLGRELDETRARAERLRSQVRSLASPPTSMPGVSERIRSMLQLAQTEVEEMLAQAETETARRRVEAERDAGRIRAAAQADAERSATEDAQRRAESEAECAAASEAIAHERRASTAAAKDERAAALAHIARAEEDARLRLAQERAALESQRAQIEQDFTLAMNSRRAQAIAELEAGRRQTSQHNADVITTAQEQSRRTVLAAEEYARRTVAEAERGITELTAARERVAAQLGQTQAMLQQVLDTLMVMPERPASESRGDASIDTDGAGGQPSPTSAAAARNGVGDGRVRTARTNGGLRPSPTPR